MLRRFPLTRQIEERDCGPTCLHMICRYYGKFVELETIRRLSGVGKNGINVQDLIVAAESLGIRSKAYSLSIFELKDLMPLPCIVLWRGHHFSVVYKVTKRHVYIADPAKGRICCSWADFANDWIKDTENGKGIGVGCEPSVTFTSDDKEGRNQNTLDAAMYLRTYLSLYSKQLFQISFLLVLITVLSALLPIVTQSIIDSGIPRQDKNYIVILSIGSISLGIGLALGRWLQQSIGLFFAVRIKIGMMADYISRMFQMTLSFFESRTIGSIMQRNYDFDRIENFLLGSLFSFILSILSLATFGTLLFIYDSVFFWIYLIGAIIYILWVILFWSIRKKMDIKYYAYLAQNESRWVEFISNISDIKSYSYGREERIKWEKTQLGLFKTRIKLLNVEQIQNMGTNIISSTRDAVLVYLSAISVINGDITIGVMGAVLFIIGQLRSPLDGIVNFIISWQLFQISFQRVSDVFVSKGERLSSSHNDEMLSYTQPIILKGVSFRYSPSSPLAINNLSIVFPQGKIIALVGASGSGKSTLIKILARLYEPTGGRVCIGNTDLESLAVSTWRKHLGVLTQESSLVSDTIANNISYGRPFDKDKMEFAVSVANIKWEIESLPLGYDTVIGDRGKGLSEGQKQRILLARAVYDNPDYLLLDEITSTLDVRNEHLVMTAIKEHLSGKSIIIAAHRLSTAQMADEICVLKSGFLVERGTHNMLVTNRKEYYNLFKTQLDNNE